MAEKAERITVKIRQRNRNLRIYYIDDMLLSIGASDLITHGDDVEDFDTLTALGQALVSRLLNYPGIDLLKLYNYEMQVVKGEMFSWTGRHDLDRVVLHEIAQAIAEELESVHLEVAALIGEEAGDVEIDLHLVGDRPVDHDPFEDDDEVADEESPDDSESEEPPLAPPTEEEGGPLAA
jgi:hypothetical protein